MGNCCKTCCEEAEQDPAGKEAYSSSSEGSRSGEHNPMATSRQATRDVHVKRGPITSQQAHSNYLREKLKAKEERQPLLQPADRGHVAIVDPRKAAHKRGQKLTEAEEASDRMKSAATQWNQTASAFKTS